MKSSLPEAQTGMIPYLREHTEGLLSIWRDSPENRDRLSRFLRHGTGYDH
ncbi:hypothetical protein J2X69_003190 [Algoriphagus sp. 4150]|nr:hypothetical protein [Algoriphagus sp. 4150]MDR7130831.1 hypothetical protein [Algoriphagus sp. 4150]